VRQQHAQEQNFDMSGQDETNTLSGLFQLYLQDLKVEDEN